MEKSEKTFEYTYSAPQQDEIKKIREKYIPKEETKIEQLRRLDESVTKKGQACSIALGTLSTLVLGIGMCCTMIWDAILFIPGILVGCIGIAGICAAYPVFDSITRKEKERLTPEILRLSGELMNGQC